MHNVFCYPQRSPSWQPDLHVMAVLFRRTALRHSLMLLAAYTAQGRQCTVWVQAVFLIALAKALSRTVNKVVLLNIPVPHFLFSRGQRLPQGLCDVHIGCRSVVTCNIESMFNVMLASIPACTRNAVAPLSGESCMHGFIVANAI